MSNEEQDKESPAISPEHANYLVEELSSLEPQDLTQISIAIKNYNLAELTTLKNNLNKILGRIYTIKSKNYPRGTPYSVHRYGRSKEIKQAKELAAKKKEDSV